MDEKVTKAERKEIRKQERHAWEEKLNKEEKIQTYKKTGLWTAIALGTILIIWGLTTLLGTPSTINNSIKMPPISSSDISTGPANAKVTLVEYADLQCPTCALYHPILKQLLHDFNGKIRFIYRFFPLPTLHQNAIPAAKAAYASYLQGKFWEMHDMLFETQNSWALINNPEDLFTTYAKNLGLDTNQFKKDFEAESTQKFIDAEENTGANAGVIGTPTFFINGKQIDNPKGYQPFKSLIQSYLK